ncbi:AbrB/MazE/SpoVT family DNA-binding domain-containing protein [Halobacillus halophilus]|uniref:AbrB/MazE/SpoVT family DNA-binding domain-containing protein n=1 Tax=Halobacillus halophilus TaxID=1570 RepID=UPI001CD7214A|nr:AbrB/MazE/SpoVT family DNA-binding domain-containing protein [Halobacillus halophilus]MCA1012798.1 hypothetical protein [Halobacillus halophilus]
MEMSRLYIKSSLTGALLEVASSKEVICAYEEIKKNFPGIELTVFGAKDASSLRRSHRTLDTSHIVKTVPEFIAALPNHAFKIIETQKVVEMGKSLGIGFPKSIVDLLNILPGDEIEFKIKNNQIILSKKGERDKEGIKMLNETLAEHDRVFKNLKDR